MQIDWKAFTDTVTMSLKNTGDSGDTGDTSCSALKNINKNVTARLPEVSPVNLSGDTSLLATGDAFVVSKQGVSKPVTGVTGVTGHFRQGAAAFSDCLRKLRAMPAPDTFWGDRWGRLIHDGEAFVASWGEQAARLGWTDLDLFGVHPTRPACRFDVMGLVPLIDGGRIVALTDTAATTRRPSGSIQRYTRKSMDGALCLWELA